MLALALHVSFCEWGIRRHTPVLDIEGTVESFRAARAENSKNEQRILSDSIFLIEKASPRFRGLFKAAGTTKTEAILLGVITPIGLIFISFGLLLGLIGPKS